MVKRVDVGLKVIEQWLKYQIRQGDLPGFQVCIRNDGKIIFEKAYGYADIKLKKKFTTRKLARIASQSKSITAALALKLQSVGVLNLSDPVIKFIPELSAHIDTRFKLVTVSDLLSNRSGMIRDSLVKNYWGSLDKFPSRDELIGEIIKTRLVFNPNEKTKYSNFGYALLGLVLEAVTGKKYSELVEQEILQKLGISQIKSDYGSGLNLAEGYIRTQSAPGNFKKVLHRSTGALSPAAGICANTASSTKFFYEFYKNEAFLPKKVRTLIQSKSWSVTNDSDEYGLGLIFKTSNKNLYIGHSGGFPGFSSQTWYSSESKFIFGFLTNLSTSKTFNFISGMNEILLLVSSLFSEKERITVSRPIRDNYSSTIYVVGEKYAIAFPINNWLPTEEAMIYKKRKDGYFCEELSGFQSAGEPLNFIFKGNEIKAVKSGGFLAFPLYFMNRKTY